MSKPAAGENAGDRRAARGAAQAAGVHLKVGWAVTEVRAAKGRRLELHARRPRRGGGGAGRLRAASLLGWDQARPRTLALAALLSVPCIMHQTLLRLRRRGPAHSTRRRAGT